MIPRRTPLRRTPLKRKPRHYVVPPEVLAYWEWIRQQACAVPGCASNVLKPWAREGLATIEVAHVGMRGLSQLCDGWEVISLCRWHHNRGFPESHHGQTVLEFSRFGSVCADPGVQNAIF